MTSSRGFRNDLERIGGPAALSTPVIASTATVMFVVALLLNVLRDGSSVAESLFPALGSTLLTVVFLAVARVTVLPVKPGSSRPGVALLVFAAAGAVRSLTFSFLLGKFGAPIVTGRPLLTSIAMTVLVMSLATLIASGWEEHRSTLARLNEEHRRLLALGATFEERVAESERNLQEQIHSKLDPAIEEIDQLLGSEADTTGQADTARVLSQAVNDIVRPMSHELGESASAASMTIEEAIYEPYELPVSQSRANVRMAIQPVATVLLCSVLILSYASRGVAVLGLYIATALFMVVCIWAVLAMIRFLWPAHVSVPLVTPAVLVLLALNAIAGLLIASLIRWVPPAVLPFDRAEVDTFAQRNAVAAGVAVVVIGSALSILAMARQRVEEVEDDLRDVNRRLSIAVTQLRGQLWVNRRNLSWILHGPVQSALVSAALEIANPELGSGDRTRIKERIRQAIANIDSTSRREAKLVHALGEIASVWDFSCEVTWAVSDELRDRLENDPTTTMTLIEIVREAVGNSVRHGGATHVHVDITLDAGLFAHVEIQDDGSGLPDGSAAGLGTAMLDEVAHDWHRNGSSDGTSLVADIPLQV